MAEGPDEDGQDRTEAPTPRRLERARDDGDTAISQEFVKLASFGGAVLALAITGPAAFRQFAGDATALVERAGHDAQPAEAMWALASGAAPFVLAVALMGAVAAAAATFLQTRFLVSGKGLQPQLSRISPLAGARKLFGRHALEELLRSVIKLAGCLAAVWWALRDPSERAALTLLASGTAELASVTWQLALRLLLAGLAALAFVALLDLLWVNWQYLRKLRMSREDLRREQKDSEGDPMIRGRRRQIMRQRSGRRTLESVLTATVVLINPTHYAVVLAYDRGHDAAPRLVAKGADRLARRIRETAESAGVPVISNPPLARALFVLPEDTQIPEQHFAAVAEVIAYVWRLRGRHGV
jgi:flagellar biosynthetic protein FlhB